MQSPSLRDGLTPEQFAAFKRTAINTIIDTGTKLQMDQIAIATAVVFLHRFYATKSLVRNDPFMMSVACLYLGGKVEDSPKSVRDVLMASCELRYRDTVHRLQRERELYEGLRERVFVAERALLYALDFQFNVEQPYQPCLSMLNTEPLRSHREAMAARDKHKAFQLAQFAIHFINDSLKTEACLHFSGTQIAAACIWLSMKLLKEESHVYTAQGQLWWVAAGVREEHLEGVEALLQEVYSRNLYDIYSDKNLVLQSAGMLSPQQLQAHALLEAATAKKEHEAAAAAAAGSQQHPPVPPPQQHEKAGALPRPPGGAGAAPPIPVAAAAAVAPVAAVQQQGGKADGGSDSDYDDLLGTLDDAS